MTMLNCMKHSISSTRRWSFSLSIISPFILQTIIWNVGQWGFVLWVTTPKSLMLVMSSRFTNCTLYCDFLHVQRFWANLPAPLLALLWFLCFWIQSLEIQWGNIFNVVWQTQIIDVCKLIIFFSNILLHFHDQITRSKMSLKNFCRMYFHPLSNGLIIGFKRPVFIIDVCWCKNPCYVM